MSDRLYLSCWVDKSRGFSEKTILRQFEKLLELFPSSKLAKAGPVAKVYAIGFDEPLVFEKLFDPGAAAGELILAVRDFVQPDCAVEIEAAWDLWQWLDGDWKLSPAAVTLSCYGPDFEREGDDDLRIDFGLDAKFLPSADVEGSARMGQSNLRSLLRLAGEVEKTLPLERRQVWSESGANFAELLAEAVRKFGVN